MRFSAAAARTRKACIDKTNNWLSRDLRRPANSSEITIKEQLNIKKARTFSINRKFLNKLNMDKTNKNKKIIDIAKRAIFLSIETKRNEFQSHLLNRE